MTADELKVGRTYCAKKPGKIHQFGGRALLNDRQIKWISSDRSIVQYDGPAVANGRYLPRVTMEAFLKWADRDVTELSPARHWREAPT